jgi:hypothetical protein
MEFTEKYINAQISYFVSLHYVQQQNGFRQALVVLHNCAYQIEEAIELYQHELSSIQKGDKLESMADELKNQLFQKVQYAECKCQAKYLMHQYSQGQSTQTMQIDSTKKQTGQFKRVKIDNLYDLLFQDSTKMKTDANLSQHV